MEQYRFDPYTGQPLSTGLPTRTWVERGYPPYRGMPQQPQQPPADARQAQPNVIVRRVASYDEAKAVPTDFSGVLTIMPDWAHGCIYAKALGDDGSPVFRVFRDVTLPPPPAAEPAASPAPTVAYAPLEELERLREEVDALRKELASAKAPAKDPVEKPSGKGSKT